MCDVAHRSLKNCLQDVFFPGQYLGDCIPLPGQSFRSTQEKNRDGRPERHFGKLYARIEASNRSLASHLSNFNGGTGHIDFRW